MSQTNAEVQKKFRERQLLYNREEYLQKKRDNYKKYYKKKFKDGEEPEEEIKNNIYILGNIYIYIIYGTNRFGLERKRF